MTRLWLSILVAAAFGLAPGGCVREDAAVDAGPALRSSAGDGRAGFGLTVSADREEIRTVDRLSVVLETVRPAGSALTVVEPEWTAPAWGGWRVVGRDEAMARAGEDGRIRTRVVVRLEPFLDGVYRIPPVEASGGERSLSTAAMEVRVVSVLGEDDPGELAGAWPAAAPEPGGGVGAGVVVLAAGGVALGALLVAWRLGRVRGGRDEEHGPSALGSLRAVAEGRADGPEAMAMVHRALEGLGRSGVLGGLAARCERARFSPGGSDDARSIARAALEAVEGRGEGGA